MQLSARCVISRFTAVALCVGLLSACATESRITIEAVDVYSCGTLKNNAANVDNFRDRMLSIAGYTSGVRFTDGLVWTTDFTDPEVVAGGDDSSNFDRSGDVIAEIETDKATMEVEAIDDGTLAKIQKEWLSSKANAPVLK